MREPIATPGPPRRPLVRIWRAIRQRPFVTAFGLLVIVSTIFFLTPGLDPAVSHVFYTSAGGFAAWESPVLETWRRLGTLVEWALGVAVAAPLLLKILLPEHRLAVRPRTTLFVLASFALGPGLIVNGILKEHWGRARPRAILEFGGDATFSPVWWISDQCVRNCSFVSGEAAGAFCLVALVFIVRAKQRIAVAVFTLSFATIVSFTRIAVGAHFVSDVLIAWLISLCVMLALDRLVLKGLPAKFDHAVEASAARAGLALRRFIRSNSPPEFP